MKFSLFPIDISVFSQDPTTERSRTCKVKLRRSPYLDKLLLQTQWSKWQTQCTTVIWRHLACCCLRFSSQRGIKGFYSKTAPYMNFTLSVHFLRFYKVKYLKFYEWVLQISWHPEWRHSDVTKWAILRDFQYFCWKWPVFLLFLAQLV